MLATRSTTAARVVLEAVLLGLLADALLRVGPWGLNIALWIAALGAGTIALARRRSAPIARDVAWLAVPLFAFTLAFAWHDAEQLTAFNVLGVLALLGLLASALAPSTERAIARTRLRELVLRLADTAFQTVFGAFPLLLSDLSVRTLVPARGLRSGVAALRGAVIAIPLLLIFGALFAAADPAFDRLARAAIGIDPDVLFSHLALTGFFTWIAAGYLRSAFVAERPVLPAVRLPHMAIGRIETGFVLGTLDALFATFVALQFRWFFGGDALVQSTSGLSYAEYARRGFFELVTVTALVIPVLVGSHAAVRRFDRGALRLHRWLAGTLIVLVGVVMASALARMRLYVSAYGLTNDRLYATAFMLWLALVLGWLAFTVLRGHSRRFVAGAIASAAAVLVSLNVLDPDALVMRVNLARAAHGVAFDAEHASTLSADAAPLLVGTLTAPSIAIEPKAACVAARSLIARWGMPTGSSDWRTWNVGRSRARRAVRARESELRRIGRLPPFDARRAEPPPPC